MWRRQLVRRIERMDGVEINLIEEDESGDKEVKVAYCWGGRQMRR